MDTDFRSVCGSGAKNRVQRLYDHAGYDHEAMLINSWDMEAIPDYIADTSLLVNQVIMGAEGAPGGAQGTCWI